VKLVLDTNAIWNDSFLSAPSLVTLAREQKRIGYSVYMPEVVVQEQVKHFRQRREELAKEFRKLEGLFAGVSTGRFPKLSPRPALESYEEDLRSRLKELAIQVLAYPKVSNEALVRRAVQERRPFKTKEQQGFHDVLIWENVLQIATGRDADEVVLVSGDSGFGENALDPTLQEEAKERGGRSVSLLKSVKAAVDIYVNPHLEAISNLKASLTSGALTGFVREWLEQNLDRELSNREFTKRELGLQHSNFVAGYWENTRRLLSVEATDAKKTEQGLVIARMHARVEANVSCVEYVPDSVRPVPDMWTDYQTERRIADVEIEWLFDPQASEVKNFSIVSVAWP